jgi:Flp pilus assembly protein TadD
MPQFFSARRLEAARALHKAAPPAALALMVRAETRLTRDDLAGAEEALEAATKGAPDLLPAILQLALVQEQAGAFDRAALRYREVLKLQPNNTVALNNLAYHLAVRANDAKQAVPLARRAFTLVPTSVSVLDTLAWAEHLAGNSEEAARLLRRVVQRDTGLHELHLHAATIFAAVGDLRAAETQLTRAVELNPASETSEEVQRLRKQLQKR